MISVDILIYKDDVTIQGDITAMQLAPQVVKQLKDQIYENGQLKTVRYILWYRNNSRYKRPNGDIVVPYPMKDLNGLRNDFMVTFKSHIYENKPTKGDNHNVQTDSD